MDNQQEPFNSPSLPKMGERETEHQHIAPRLKPKTKLRGLSQQQPGSGAARSAPVENADENGPQSFTQTPEPWTMPGTRSLSPQPAEPDTETFPQPQRLSWNEMAARAFHDAQQPLGETTTHEFSSPAQQSHSDTSTSAVRSVQPSPSSGQSKRSTSRFNKPKFSKSAFSKRNSQRINAGSQNNRPLTTTNMNTQAAPSLPANADGTPGDMYPTPNATRELSDTDILPDPTSTLSQTGALMHPAGEYSGDTGMLKLNQAVKVVRIPVAGKPGEYKTGILPIQEQDDTSSLPPTAPQQLTIQEKLKKNSKLVALTALIVLILFSSGIYLFTRTTGNTTASVNTNKNLARQVSVEATATAKVQATATFEKSELINDPLSSNARSWKTTQPADAKKGLSFTFKANAYHIGSIKTGDLAYFANSVLVSEVPPATFTYSVDMQQVKGDDGTDYNFFGLLFNYTQIHGQAVSYAFRIIDNKHKPRYEFCTLDGNRTPIWSDPPLWKHDAGKEFHGTKAKNTLQVHMDKHNFTFWVNGTQVGKVHDSSYGPGAIGLGVNGLPGGAEVAFTNLLLTSN